MSRRTIIRGPLLPVWRALPPAAQRVVRKTVDRYSSLRRREPLLSVIVPVYNVEEYLEECLDSLMAQTLLDMQVVIIDDGSTDGSAQIYQRYAAADPRVLVHRQPNAGLGAARNAGIARSTGRYLTFLDADDTLPTTAYETMVTTLEKSGSDFLVGSVRRVTAGKVTSAPWIDQVHGQDRIGITIDEFPTAVMDVIACNRMVRRQFWDRIGLTFPEGVAYEDHAPMMTAYVRATTFDILRAVTYYWRIRENQTSIGQQKRQTQNLKDRVRAKEDAAEVLKAYASAKVRDAWLQRVLDLDLTGFINQVEVTDQAYWDVLSHAARTFLRAATPEVLSQVRADRKVKTWLVAQNRRAELIDFMDQRRHEGSHMRTEVIDGTVRALLPFHDDAGLAVPRELYTLSDAETALVTSLRSFRATEDGALEIEGWAYIRYVDLSAREPTLRAWLVNDQGERRELAVHPFTSPAATRWGGHRYQSYDQGGFAARIDVAELAAPVPGDARGTAARWRVEVSVTVDGLERTGVINHRDIRSSAGYLPAVSAGTTRVVPLMVAGEGLVLEVRQPHVVLNDISFDDRTVRGTLRAQPTDSLTTLVATSCSGETVATRLKDQDGLLGFELDLPDPDWGTHALDRRFWTLQASASGGRRKQRVSWPDDDRTQWRGTAPGAPLAALRTERHNVELREVACYPVIDDVDLAADRILMRGHWVGGVPQTWHPVLTSARMTVIPTSVTTPGQGLFEVTFPVEVDEWGAGSLPLPPGTYSLRVDLAPAAEDVPGAVLPRMGEALIQRTTVDALSDRLRLQLRRGPMNHILLVASAPLGDEVVSNRAQASLQRWYAESDIPAEPDAVLFQCYRGETATDSQLALHMELRRRAWSGPLYWGVSDYSVAVPDGGIPVLMRSEEWYTRLAAAGHLVNNIDFDRFFVKRGHQRFLQTFHGYPFKSMGIAVWSKTATEARIAQEVARRNEAWDVILTPTPEMNEHYRREYRYTGTILDVGYPRNDALVDEHAEQTRKSTREVLGVAEHQTVVMYAPTWRDTLATGTWSARLPNYLDFAAASEALGEDFVLLMRGHNFNARTDARTQRTARVIDVTDYPQINDLVLASDAAVLDYSSLRFDYALTGKPMVFLVPDLDSYGGAERGFLFDYADTAPGPLLQTTAEVVAALQDLPGVKDRHAAAYEKFNTTFNYLHDGHASQRVADAFFGPSSRS